VICLHALYCATEIISISDYPVHVSIFPDAENIPGRNAVPKIFGGALTYILDVQVFTSPFSPACPNSGIPRMVKGYFYETACSVIDFQ
jgi:hypothetical protein